jgi:hypothetical protein
MVGLAIGLLVSWCAHPLIAQYLPGGRPGAVVGGVVGGLVLGAIGGSFGGAVGGAGLTALGGAVAVVRLLGASSPPGA